MKNIRNYISLIGIASVLLFGCKKDENKDYFLGGTAPVISSDPSVVVLLKPDAAKNAMTISWTNPNFKFTTGTSSQSVRYQVELDAAGKNFSSSGLKVLPFTSDLSVTYKVGELNKILLSDMKFKPGEEQSIEARVTAYLTDLNGPKVVSNVLSIKVTAYEDVVEPKVVPPTDGTLWLTGTITALNFTNPLPAPYDVDQKFTKLSNTLYELTITVLGGGGYKLIQTNGVWGTQYHQVSGTWDSGTFEKKDSDPQFPGPPNAGQYKITIDFQEGVYTVVKL